MTLHGMGGEIELPDHPSHPTPPIESIQLQEASRLSENMTTNQAEHSEETQTFQEEKKKTRHDAREIDLDRLSLDYYHPPSIPTPTPTSTPISTPISTPTSTPTLCSPPSSPSPSITSVSPKTQPRSPDCTTPLALTIAMRDVNVAVKVPLKNIPLPTLFTSIRGTFDQISGCIQRKPVSQDFYRLKNVSGLFQPGTMTLVLSPPGNGRSSYLKAIQSSLALTGGNIYYNGLSQAQCRKNSIDLTKLIQYQEQTDLHIAELTVNESIEFAMKMGSTQYSPEKVTSLLDELGIIECRDVLVGSATVRGISGGQRRRLSTGISLSSDANVMTLDSLTDGLDSAVAEKIICHLKKWTRTDQTQCIITLQQPTPQIFDLFDHLVLLREGEVIYDGNPTDVIPFFEAMGYPIAGDVDVCDFLMDVLSQPRFVLQTIKINQIRQEKVEKLKLERAAKNAKNGKMLKTGTIPKNPTNTTPSSSLLPQSSPNPAILSDILATKIAKTTKIGERLKNGHITTSFGPIQPSSVPCITTEEMVEYFHTTPHWKVLNDGINASISTHNPHHVQEYHDKLAQSAFSDYNHDTLISQQNEQNEKKKEQDQFQLSLPASFRTDEFKKRYTSGYRQSIITMLFYVLQRQWKLQWRAKSIYISRALNTIILGFLYAALYYQVAMDDYRLRVAAILLSFSQVIYNNMMDLASTNMIKPLIKQQMQQSMYPAWAWVVSYALLTFPYLLGEVTIFVLIFYFMEGFTLNVGAWFTYWALFLFVSLTATFWFRFLAIIAPDYPTASVLAAPTASYFLIFSGFYISRSNLPQWLIWYYWISPYSWLTRALTINEFRMSRYDTLIPNALNPIELRRKGTLFLEYMDIFTEDLWILWAVIYCTAFCILLVLLSSLALQIKPSELSRGTRRVEDLGNDVDELNELLQNEEQKEAHTKAMKAMNDAILNNQQFFANEVAVSKQHNGDYEMVENNQLADTDSKSKSKSKSFLQRHPNPNPNDDIGNDNNSNAHIASIPVGLDGNDFSTSKSICSHLSSPSILSHIATTQLSQINKSANQKNTLKTLTEKLPFSPTIVSFSNIRYTVSVINALNGNVSQKVLLDNVNGFAQNGFCTFLCGASGAGKTTLLDVLAGRKTTGVIEGTILFNGVAATKAQQHSLIGFVEQFDSLFEYASVEETLQYATELRLPPDTDRETKIAVVEEILQILDLTPVRNYIIGGGNTPGLSPAQRKLVSIGLELVANKPVLYFDEPTTGIDSRSAQTVMRAIKRVAQSGRTCILTIHQPSAELSYYADALSLLGPGGQQCFFGDVGFRFHHLVNYWKTIPGIAPLPFRSNVTTWLLEESSKMPDPNQISIESIKKNTTILENSPKMRQSELYLSATFSGSIIDSDININNDNDEFIDVSNFITPMTHEEWDALRPNQQWVLYLKWYYYAKCPQWIATKKKLDQIERIYYTSLGLANPVEGVQLIDDFHVNQTGMSAITEENVNHGGETMTAVQVAPGNDHPLDDFPPLAVSATTKNDTVDIDAPVIVSSHEVSSMNQNNQNDIHPDHMSFLGSIQPPQHPSILGQLGIFISRQTNTYYRNPLVIINRTLVTTITSLLAGLIYRDLQVIDASSVVSLLASIVMCSATIAMNLSAGASSLYFAARPLLYREVDSGYYSTKFVWSIGVFITEVIWAFPFSILGAIPAFFLIGLQHERGAEHFFQFLLGIFTLMIILLSTQSFFTAISRQPSLQQLLNSIAFGAYFALGGFAVPYSRLRSLSWFHQVLYWLAPLGTLNFFYNCIFFGSTTKTIEIIQNDALVEVSLREYASQYFGFDYEFKWFYYGLLILHILVIQILYNLAMVFVNHNKR